MSKQGDPRKTHQYKVARLKFLQQHTTCALCGLPLDFDAPAKSRWAPTVDHIIALDNGGKAHDVRNWQPAHHGCNSSKGARDFMPSPRSRRW